MKKLAICYAVVIAIGTLLTLSIVSGSMTLRGLCVSLGTALLAGFYELDKKELRAQTERIIGDLKHHVNNALQGIIYAREIQPDNEAEVVREGLMRVRRAFSGSGLIGDISHPCPAGTEAGASRKSPQSQKPKLTARGQGIA